MSPSATFAMSTDVIAKVAEDTTSATFVDTREVGELKLQSSKVAENRHFQSSIFSRFVYDDA